MISRPTYEHAKFGVGLFLLALSLYRYSAIIINRSCVENSKKVMGWSPFDAIFLGMAVMRFGNG